MIEPRTLAELTEMYESKVARLAGKMASQAATVAESSPAMNLKMIMDARELWEEIKDQIASADFYILPIDGMPGSGKTTLGRELAHHAHSDGFKLLYYSSFDILDAPVTAVQQAKGTSKVCIVLDDMSYTLAATSGKMQSKIKNFISMIRHALSTPQVKAQIFIMVMVHFTTAIPPMLKNSNVWIFTKPTTQENDYMVKIVGRKEELRQRMQDMFSAVKAIQDAAKPGEALEFSMYGKDFTFKWGGKDDPGDGRLCLIINSGEALMYRSTNLQCPACEFIGKDVQVRAENYQQEKRDREEDD